ncbi:erythromycin esterase [Sphaerisporangium album]|uniref:Erythromycin esterase n=1 Tax=Sphaerisporangium album TaxID=509200 RepID=A0A367FC96_9ACTN|nr:erythromycin esterase family protein [Sphaerisporangium album]RCG27315.1 erythromycin esterase [Sphaerisporangium album]
MSDHLFRDRRDAGRALAGLLDHYRGEPGVLVLALPRGGVPVGFEVARALGAPLDVFLARKLGVPGQEDLAMGAVAGDGVIALNDDVIRGLAIPAEVVEHVADWEGREIPRWERHFRQDRPPRPIEGQVVILVDDGLSTGAGLRAAVKALRRSGPARVVVALPAVAQATCEDLAAQADEVVYATTPSPYSAVDQSYWDFAEITVEDVRDLLRASAASLPARAWSPGSGDVTAVRAEALPTEGGVPHPNVLADLVGDARLVLLGGASHGTHEFYAARAAMTRWLIEEKGFRGVAVQADWPDAYRVNRYVRGCGHDTTAEEALRDFRRFPVWMWRNTVVLGFVAWLREHNHRVLGEHPDKAGFYGLDLFGTHQAMRDVVSHLEAVDPAAAACARERYACFDHLGSGEAQAYGFTAACGAGEACEDEVVQRLVHRRREALGSMRRQGLLHEDELFFAELNARAAKSADEHYRSMFAGRIASWNARDRHMADTLDALLEHLSRHRGRPAKIVVWAHNAHVGDARATEAACRGEINLGGLVRERHGDDCRIVGLTTYTGTVTAADHWEGPAERKWLRPALSDSVEELFHEVGEKEFLTSFRTAPRTRDVLGSARLERMVGAVYRPRTERRSHYFRARPAGQFDAVVHVDETRAVEPLDDTDRWVQGELPETYPAGV